MNKIKTFLKNLIIFKFSNLYYLFLSLYLTLSFTIDIKISFLGGTFLHLFTLSGIFSYIISIIVTYIIVSSIPFLLVSLFDKLTKKQVNNE